MLYQLSYTPSVTPKIRRPRPLKQARRKGCSLRRARLISPEPRGLAGAPVGGKADRMRRLARSERRKIALPGAAHVRRRPPPLQPRRGAAARPPAPLVDRARRLGTIVANRQDHD